VCIVIFVCIVAVCFYCSPITLFNSITCMSSLIITIVIIFIVILYTCENLVAVVLRALNASQSQTTSSSGLATTWCEEGHETKRK